MQRTKQRWSATLIVVCLLSASIFAQDTSRPPQTAASTPVDEAALRTLASDFFAAYAKKDLEGFIRLWSAKAPELASRRETMEALLAAHENIEVKSLTVGQLTVDGEKASVRVAVEISAVEVKTNMPATVFGKMNRVLSCITEQGAWKVWREEAAEEDLAAALVGARTEEERTALLAAEKELITVELRKALITQGNKLRVQGNYPQALSVHALAQRIAEQIDDKAGIASVLRGIGIIHSYQGNYGLALEFYQKSLRLSEALEEKKLIADALNQIGVVQYLQGNYGLALDYYQKSLALKEALGDKRGIAESQNGLGSVHYYQGDYGLALEYFQKGLSLSEALEDKQFIAYGLSQIGLVHSAQSNYSLALEYYQKALKLSEALGDKNSIAYTLNHIGVCYYYHGNYSLALEYYQKSLGLMEVLGGKRGIANTLTSFGAVHLMQGNTALALKYYEKSLALKEALGGKRGIANTLIGIGIIHRHQGNDSLALEYCQKGLSLSEALGDKQLIAYALNQIGLIHSAQSNYSLALEYFQKGLALKETIGHQHGIAESLKSIASLHYKQGNYRLALETASRAVAIARQVGEREMLWEARTVAGQAYRTLNQPTQARQAFEEAIATIESLRAEVAGGEQDQQRFFEDKVSPFHAMVELLATQNKPGEALVYAERAKARVLLDVLRSGRVNVTKAMTAQEQEQERKLKTELASFNSQLSRQSVRPRPDQTRLTDLEARLHKTRLDYEAFQTNLYAAHPELKSQRGETQPMSLEESGALLPDANSALLEYVVTDEKTYLFVLTKGDGATQGTVESKVYTVVVKRNDLADRVERFRQQLSQRDLGFRKPARELYDLLLGPAREQLRGRASLIMVPDAVLWELPFQVLRSDENRYLLEDFQISYAPSLTVLREMVKLRRKKTDHTNAPANLLAFGNPALDQASVERVRLVTRDKELSPLPEAEQEVKTLGKMYGATWSKVYVGVEAREDRAKSEAGKFRVLHLATHGILNDASPMYSQVVLAQGSGSASEDGLLEAWEIMNLDLQADLVVLSACETGRGRVGAGEGMIGLTWALFVAGSPTAVVSQWKVASTSTTALMVEFHRQLRARTSGRQAGVGIAEALRRAALKQMRSDDYWHPFYWASFVVIGDGR